jgi:hypothetical protein
MRRFIMLLLVVVAVFPAEAENFRRVLGREAINQVVTDELKGLKTDIVVENSYIEWSVEAIEKCDAPSDTEQARQLLAAGYREFVGFNVQFVESLGVKRLSREWGKKFLRLNRRCGPTPCNPRKCCEFCRKPCP